MGSNTESSTSKLRYYSCLWQGNLLLFLILDFSKRLDDSLLSLTASELAANAFAPLLLSALASFALGAISSRLEPLTGPRPIHIGLVFTFLTINLWSLKTGWALRLQDLSPSYRLGIAVVALLLVLLASFGLGSRGSHPWRWAIAYDARFLKLLAVGIGTAGLFTLWDLPNPGQRPSATSNVILVSFDALSAEHCSLYGYPRQTTPELERLAEQSWVFENFRANFTNTPPSLIAMEGSLPEFHGAVPFPTAPGLFQLLQNAGYPHRAFFSYLPTEWFFGFQGRKLLNVYRGPVDTLSQSGRDSFLYRSLTKVLSERQLRWTALLLSEELYYFWPYSRTYDSRGFFEKRNRHPAAHSYNDALDYLDAHPSGSFVWLHLWDPHYPYWPPKDLRGKFGKTIQTPAEFINREYEPGQAPWVESLKNRYDETVLGADREFGEFVEQLRRRGLLDTSWLVVSSDHGEAFSRGFVGHAGHSVHESISRVPLIIRPPGGGTPLRIKTPASQIDLAPTLLALLDRPPVASLPGESLLPYIKAPDTLSSIPKFTISERAYTGNVGWVAVYWKQYKLEYANQDIAKVRLFDLSKDPSGVNNIAPGNVDLVVEIQTKVGLR